MDDCESEGISDDLEYKGHIEDFLRKDTLWGIDRERKMAYTLNRYFEQLFKRSVYMLKTIIKVKESLQYTGWLQYIIPMVQVVILFLVGSLFSIFGLRFIGNFIWGVASLLLIRNAYDILVVKWGIRPKEKRPKRNDHLNLVELMHIRRSCRSFQKNQLTESDKLELLNKSVDLTNKNVLGEGKIRFEYISSKLDVWPVVNAQEFLVAIVPKTYNRRNIYEVGIKLQQLVIYATKMGLGTCWIGPGADQKTVMQALGNKFNEENDHIICVCAIGYESKFYPIFLRTARWFQRLRKPMADLFFEDLDLSKTLKIDELDDAMKNVLRATRRSPSAFNGQPVRCVKKGEEFLFYTVKKSRYYAPVAAGIWAANWSMACDYYKINGKFSIEAYTSDLPRYEFSWIKT